MLNPYSADKLDKKYSKEILVGGKNGIIKERMAAEKRLCGYVTRTHAHPEITQFRKKWYPNGIKIVPNDLVLTPQNIAVWYFDDGSNHVKNRCISICTQSFTLEEADFLCDKLSDFDIEPSIVKVISTYTGRPMPILKIHSTSYDNLINLVKPYCLWGCFKYKVEWRRALNQWEFGKGKLTPNDVNDIRELRKTKTAREIAKLYDVHVNTVYAIVSYRRRS